MRWFFGISIILMVIGMWTYLVYEIGYYFGLTDMRKHIEELQQKQEKNK